MRAVRYASDHRVRKRRTENIRSDTALWLLIGLIIALLLVSCYLHAPPQAVTTTTNANAANCDKRTLCVRKGIDRCQFYPCEDRGGVMKEIMPPNPNFGYAGSFVRRIENITKPIPECELCVCRLLPSLHAPLNNLMLSTQHLVIPDGHQVAY